MRLIDADALIEKDWEIARGCRVEQFVACHYMPQILRMYESKQNCRRKEPFKCLTL